MNRLNYAARPFLGCALLLATAALLQGCAGLDAANSIYNGARNWQNLSKSSAMLKDLTNAQPHFAGYNSVFVVADIAPRDNSAAVTQAWIGNMADYTQSVARAMRAPLQVCTVATQCSGKTLIVQFREEAYDANFVEKYTIGSKIKGKVVYLDKSDGRILGESRSELAESYADLAKPVSASILTSMYKSFPPTTADAERVGKEIESIPPLGTLYEPILKKTS